MWMQFAVLLIFLALVSGYWFFKRSNRTLSSLDHRFDHLKRDYFIGLNYLINDQTDKAVDIFIKMLEVDGDTVETHVALGSLFRRRGEVDRAIRIHQNIIARPHLEKIHYNSALFELGKDYLAAGVLDRAERLFLQLASAKAKHVPCLRYLLEIYQQEKDWEKATHTARTLETATGEPMNTIIAQHYCEQAEIVMQTHPLQKALPKLKQALNIDPHCVRASYLQGQLFMQQNRYRSAIHSFWRIKKQDPDFLSEVITPLSECYSALGDEISFIERLKYCLKEHPRVPILLMLSSHIRKVEGDKAAIEFMTEQIARHTTLRGLAHLIDLYIDNAYGDTRQKLVMLLDIVKKSILKKPLYRCSHCGFSGKEIYWLCPSCKGWSLIKPIHGLEGG